MFRTPISTLPPTPMPTGETATSYVSPSIPKSALTETLRADGVSDEKKPSPPSSVPSVSAVSLSSSSPSAPDTKPRKETKHDAPLPPKEKRKTIRVISLDADGCLYNKPSTDAKQRHDFYEGRPLYEKIMNDLKDCDEAILMLGSNRQSLLENYLNIEQQTKIKSELAYQTIEDIHQKIIEDSKGTPPCFYDVFLLPDLYNGYNSGTTWDKAKEIYQVSPQMFTFLQNEEGGWVKEIKDHLAYEKYKTDVASTGWLFDHSKFTVLYAQIHKQATENPEASIEFDFYDDKMEILDELSEAFKKNPDLLPRNVKLNLYQYDGNLKTHSSIQGTGDTDRNYRSTLIGWGNNIPCACESCEKINVDSEHKEEIGHKRVFNPLNKKQQQSNLETLKTTREAIEIASGNYNIMDERCFMSTYCDLHTTAIQSRDTIIVRAPTEKIDLAVNTFNVFSKRTNLLPKNVILISPDKTRYVQGTGRVDKDPKKTITAFLKSLPLSVALTELSTHLKANSGKDNDPRYIAAKHLLDSIRQKSIRINHDHRPLFAKLLQKTKEILETPSQENIQAYGGLIGEIDSTIEPHGHFINVKNILIFASSLLLLTIVFCPPIHDFIESQLCNPKITNPLFITLDIVGGLGVLSIIKEILDYYLSPRSCITQAQSFFKTVHTLEHPADSKSTEKSKEGLRASSA